MKRTITLAILIWLSLYSLPTVSAQERKANKVEDEGDATDIVHRRPVGDDGDAPVEKKKVVHKHVKFGIEAGASSCYLWRSDATNDPILGGRFGGFLYIPVVGKFYLQPGLYYVANGGSETVGTGRVYPLTMTTTYNVHVIEMPVNLGFRFGHKRSKYKSFIGMGPYVARNLGGTVTFDDGASLKDNLAIGSGVGENFNAFDFGVGLNAIIEWHCGLFMSGRFQYGLANLAPHVSTMNSVSDGFTLGYLFGKKSKIVKKKFRRMTEENDRYADPRGRTRDE